MAYEKLLDEILALMDEGLYDTVVDNAKFKRSDFNNKRFNLYMRKSKELFNLINRSDDQLFKKIVKLTQNFAAVTLGDDSGKGSLHVARQMFKDFEDGCILGDYVVTEYMGKEHFYYFEDGSLDDFRERSMREHRKVEMEAAFRDEKGFRYDVKTQSLRRYEGKEKHVSIPTESSKDTFGVPIIRIGTYAFYRKPLESVTIGEHIISIGHRAFSYCKASHISIPNSVTKIGSYAFEECMNLRKLVLPNKLTQIKEGTFMNSGIEELVVPDTVTYIGRSAFEGSALKKIFIPRQVKEIDNRAFHLLKSKLTIYTPKGSYTDNKYSKWADIEIIHI